MLQSQQSHRPQAKQQPHTPLNPLYQQQIRTLSSQTSESTPPRNQIEAMPPNQFYPPQRIPLPVFDPATCHPVFFTSTLRKPPFPLFNPGFGASNMANPVAFGYVAESGVKRESGSKL